MSVLVRTFRESDREPLRRLYQAARNAAFTWAPVDARPLTDFDKHTEQELILVALIGQEPVGFASIWEADSFLHNLFVHPQHQRQGVGRALLGHCAHHFTATPTLKCLQANAGAIRFYSAYGWHVIDEGESSDGPYFLMAWSQASHSL